MAEWVTFHWSLMNGVSNLIIHKDKETATEYFKEHYRQYFEINQKQEVKLPMSYGYPHRRFYGISKHKFDKEFQGG